MNTADAEFSLYEESDIDEIRWEYPAFIRPQFKDACDFGRVCRSLAIPVQPRQEFLTN